MSSRFATTGVVIPCDARETCDSTWIQHDFDGYWTLFQCQRIFDGYCVVTCDPVGGSDYWTCVFCA